MDTAAYHTYFLLPYITSLFQVVWLCFLVANGVVVVI